MRGTAGGVILIDFGGRDWYFCRVCARGGKAREAREQAVRRSAEDPTELQVKGFRWIRK